MLIAWFKNIWNCIKGWLRRRKKESKQPSFIEEPVIQKPIIKYAWIKLSGRIFNAELVRENIKTIWVRLADGNIIKRHKVRHVISI